MPPAQVEEGPPKKLTIDGVSWEVARVGKAYREKAITKPQIMSYKANWSTTWIVVRPNPSWEASKDPESYDKYISYHILFCGLANDQKFLNKSQIDALLKSTNTGAGGPSQRLDGERMLISWNGKTGWVAARTLKERASRVADAGCNTPDAAAPAAPAPVKKTAPSNGASKKMKVSSEFFWDASYFSLEAPVRVGNTEQRCWTGSHFSTLVPGLTRFKQEFLERWKPKTIKPVDPKAAHAKATHVDAPKARLNGNAASKPSKAEPQAAKPNGVMPETHDAAPALHGAAKSGALACDGSAGDLDAGVYVAHHTHAQVVQRFVDYMSGDARVPADTRAFFQTHTAIMSQIVDKYGASPDATAKVFGHMFTTSKLPPSDWTKANLEAYARTYGEENRERCLAVWQAQTGTFNQLFAAALAPKHTVSLDDLY
jgi:hypothetical protein